MQLTKNKPSQEVSQESNDISLSFWKNYTVFKPKKGWLKIPLFLSYLIPKISFSSDHRIGSPWRSDLSHDSTL